MSVSVFAGTSCNAMNSRVIEAGRFWCTPLSTVV